MKKFYKENRVFVILMGVVLVCAIIIITLAVKYAVTSRTADKYGNRADGLDDVPISDKLKSEMESSILEMEHVKKVTVYVHLKSVSFVIDVDKETSVEEAKNISLRCLDLFPENYLNVYSLQFQVTKSENDKSTSKDESTGETVDTTFPIYGAMKVGATTISWSNNAM